MKRVALIVAPFALVAASFMLNHAAVRGPAGAPTKASVKSPTAERIRRPYAAVTPVYSGRRGTTTGELTRLAHTGRLTVVQKDAAALAGLLHTTAFRVVDDAAYLGLSREEMALVRLDDLRPGLRVLAVDGRSLAHRLIDAGADVVIGTHPHWVQGIEAYRGGFIAYSLGNFVFDQEWSQKTKQGLILEAIFYDGRLACVDLTPVLVEDYHRPRILGAEEGKAVLDDVYTSSMKLHIAR